MNNNSCRAGSYVPTTYGPNIERIDSDDDDDIPIHSTVYVPTFTSERGRTGIVGLINQGATCYLNALIQSLYFTPEFRELVFKTPAPSVDHNSTTNEDSDSDSDDEDEKNTTENSDDSETKKKTKRSKDIVYWLQHLFATMQYSDCGVTETAKLTKSFGWSGSQVFEQCDVQELNRVLCDNLEEKQKANEMNRIVADVYRGKMTSMIRCTHCGKIHQHYQDFYDLPVPVKDCDDIYDSIRSFCHIDVLKGDNGYKCDNCNDNERHTAEKTMKLHELPPILSLTLSRFEYDWRIDQRVKISTPLIVRDYLQLDEFLDEKIEEPEIDNLPFKVEANNPQTVETDHEKVDAPWEARLKEKGVVIDKTADDLPEQEIIGTAGNLYELFGVIIHSGSANFGHYYAYIKHFRDGKWYLVNDESVKAMGPNWTPEAYTKQEYERAKNPVTNNYGYGSRMGGMSYGGMRSSMFGSSSTTPYVLWYRRIETELVEETDDVFDVRAVIDGTESDMEEVEKEHPGNSVTHSLAGHQFDLKKYKIKFKTFNRPEVPHELIPEYILKKLKEEDDIRKEQAEIEAQKRLEMRIEVHRCHDDLEQFSITAKTTWTFQQVEDAIREQLIEQIRKQGQELIALHPEKEDLIISNVENDVKNLSFVIREAFMRKNDTVRPGNIIEVDKELTLDQIEFFRRRSRVFIGQDYKYYKKLTETPEEVHNYIFLLIKYFDYVTEMPQMFAPLYAEKKWTVEDLKHEILTRYGDSLPEGYENLTKDNMLLFEEESEEVQRVMNKDEYNLSTVSRTKPSCQLIDGDIVVFEIKMTEEELDKEKEKENALKKSGSDEDNDDDDGISAAFNTYNHYHTRNPVADIKFRSKEYYQDLANRFKIIVTEDDRSYYYRVPIDLRIRVRELKDEFEKYWKVLQRKSMKRQKLAAKALQHRRDMARNRNETFNNDDEAETINEKDFNKHFIAYLKEHIKEEECNGMPYEALVKLELKIDASYRWSVEKLKKLIVEQSMAARLFEDASCVRLIKPKSYYSHDDSSSDFILTTDVPKKDLLKLSGFRQKNVVFGSDNVQLQKVFIANAASFTYNSSFYKGKTYQLWLEVLDEGELLSAGDSFLGIEFKHPMTDDDDEIHKPISIMVSTYQTLLQLKQQIVKEVGGNVDDLLLTIEKGQRKIKGPESNDDLLCKFITSFSTNVTVYRISKLLHQNSVPPKFDMTDYLFLMFSMVFPMKQDSDDESGSTRHYSSTTPSSMALPLLVPKSTTFNQMFNRMKLIVNMYDSPEKVAQELSKDIAEVKSRKIALYQAFSSPYYNLRSVTETVVADYKSRMNYTYSGGYYNRTMKKDITIDFDVDTIDDLWKDFQHVCVEVIPSELTLIKPVKRTTHSYSYGSSSAMNSLNSISWSSRSREESSLKIYN
eukprot:TRINITY_DN3301_c0_g1_i2.p1 TRINITY_DN3301_c0_g1~~TRINITY_DN3301_c0_g1_i2.p1  ORF type:complete len:1417 (-),score=407.99 TRINITY_DN3301_c0_g1_i2:322-4542(-)